jgi:hypothetical protein
MSISSVANFLITIMSDDRVAAAMARGYIAAVQDVSNVAKVIKSGNPQAQYPNAMAVELGLRRFLKTLDDSDFSIEGLSQELFPLLHAHQEAMISDRALNLFIEQAAVENFESESEG